MKIAAVVYQYRFSREEEEFLRTIQLIQIIRVTTTVVRCSYDLFELSGDYLVENLELSGHHCAFSRERAERDEVGVKSDRESAAAQKSIFKIFISAGQILIYD